MAYLTAVKTATRIASDGTDFSNIRSFQRVRRRQYGIREKQPDAGATIYTLATGTLKGVAVKRNR